MSSGQNAFEQMVEEDLDGHATDTEAVFASWADESGGEDRQEPATSVSIEELPDTDSPKEFAETLDERQRAERQAQQAHEQARKDYVRTAEALLEYVAKYGPDGVAARTVLPDHVAAEEGEVYAVRRVECDGNEYWYLGREVFVSGMMERRTVLDFGGQPAVEGIEPSREVLQDGIDSARQVAFESGEEPVEWLTDEQLDTVVKGYQRVVSEQFDTAVWERQATAEVVRDVVGVGDVSAWMMTVYRDAGLSSAQREVVRERMKTAVIAGNDHGALEFGTVSSGDLPGVGVVRFEADE